MANRVAFVDESRRGQSYLIACVLVAVKDAHDVRRELRTLVTPPRQRLHSYAETPARRRELLVMFDRLPIEVLVLRMRIGHDAGEHVARSSGLTSLVDELQARGVARLVIESRDGLDREDHRIISRVRRPAPPLVYEHTAPDDEPLLWLADAYAWTLGARGSWTNLVPRTCPAVLDISGP